MRGTRHEREEHVRSLVVRVVDRWPDLRIERSFANVGDDADDFFDRFGCELGTAEALSDRIPIGKVHPRQRLVDNRDLLLDAVLVREMPSTEKGGADGSQVEGA